MRGAALGRDAFDMAPIRYVTTCWQEAARLQLANTRQSVAHIAHSVGYKSEEAFSRAFKRTCAMSPTR